MERQRFSLKKASTLLSEKQWKEEWHLRPGEISGIPGCSSQAVLILQHRPYAPMGILIPADEDINLKAAANYAGKFNLPFVLVARTGSFRQFQVQEEELTCRTDWLDWSVFPTPEELWRQSEAWAFHDRRRTGRQGGESACPLGMGLSSIHVT